MILQVSWTWLVAQYSMQLLRLYCYHYSDMQSSQLRVAGLFIRRKTGQEFHTYIDVINYNPEHYEVLLRRWPSEPFILHLGAFSGPIIAGEDPRDTLLRESGKWTIHLASELFF